ncbi:MAG: hypothetical protein U5R46_10610 [Gammaproteobacteria bacterium]|nr:hypothetical protein [Gammaproteobacteria bacterium]
MTEKSGSKNNVAGSSSGGNSTTRRSASRRRLLKQMAGGGSAAVVATAFTDRWYKPVVDVVALPAHAQTSPVCTSLNASALFASNDADDTPADAGPFSCGADPSIPTGNADWEDISINGIEANISPPGTVVSLDVSGDAVSAGNANQTAQTQDSDPTNGDVTFANISFNGAEADGSDDGVGSDEDPSGDNLVLTFSSAGCDDCVIQISFTESEKTPP